MSINYNIMQLNSEENAFQRKYVEDVRRCDEMDRKLSELKILTISCNKLKKL